MHDKAKQCSIQIASSKNVSSLRWWWRAFQWTTRHTDILRVTNVVCTPYCSPLIGVRVVHLFKSILYCILNCTVLFYSVLYSSIANKYRTEGDLRDGHTSSDGERDC
jgi:uncharacterized membrane protein